MPSSSTAQQQSQSVRPHTIQQVFDHCQNMRLHALYMMNNSNLCHQIRQKPPKIVVQKNDFVLFRGICCLAMPTLLRKEGCMSVQDCMLTLYPAIKSLIDCKVFLKALEQAVETAGDDIAWKSRASLMLALWLIAVAHVYHDIRVDFIENHIEAKTQGKQNLFAPNLEIQQLFYAGMDDKYFSEDGLKEERRLAFETSKRALQLFETNVWKELESGKISRKDLYFCCVDPSLDVKKKGKTAAEGFIELYAPKELPNGVRGREVTLKSVYLDFMTLEEARASLFTLAQLFENRYELLRTGKHSAKVTGYEKALEIDPNCLKALYELAMISLRKQKCKRAAELFERCGNVLSETAEGDDLTFECFMKAALSKEAQAKAMLGARVVQPQLNGWDIEMPAIPKELSARQQQEHDLLMHQVKKLLALAEKRRVFAKENGLVETDQRKVDSKDHIQYLKRKMESLDARDKLKKKVYHMMTGDLDEIDKCSNCGRTDQKLKTCSGCAMAQYCGAECQRKHWADCHKHSCRILRERHDQFFELVTMIENLEIKGNVRLIDDRLFVSKLVQVHMLSAKLRGDMIVGNIEASLPEGECSCGVYMQMWSTNYGCSTQHYDDKLRAGVFEHVNPRTCGARDAHLREAAIKGDAPMCSFFLAHGANPRIPVRHLLIGSSDMIGLNVLEIMQKKGFILRGNTFVPKAA